MVAAARPLSQFDYLTGITGARQFVSSSQPADAGAQDDDCFASS
jgi:hypothetical protein